MHLNTTYTLKRGFITLFLTCLSVFCIAQKHRTTLFKNGTGLDIIFSPDSTYYVNRNTNTPGNYPFLDENVYASISDSNGNLLFYAGLDAIYDKNGDTMEGSYSVLETNWVSRSFPRSNPLYDRKKDYENFKLHILPDPSSKTKYYVFLGGAPYHALKNPCEPSHGDEVIDWKNNIRHTSIRYFIVDLSQNGGKGKVENNCTFLDTKPTYLMTPIKIPDENAYWLCCTSVPPNLSILNPNTNLYDDMYKDSLLSFHFYRLDYDGINYSHTQKTQAINNHAAFYPEIILLSNTQKYLVTKTDNFGSSILWIVNPTLGELTNLYQFHNNIVFGNDNNFAFSGNDSFLYHLHQNKTYGKSYFLKQYNIRPLHNTPFLRILCF